MIKLFVTDVDGVLTDGSLDYGVSCEDRKTFNAKDGQGIVMLMKRGVEVAFITGRSSHSLRVRARELGVTRLHEKARDKAQIVADIQKELGIGPESTAAMGDDIPDLAMFSQASLSFAPADAEHEVQTAATITTRRSGGRGAFRDAANHIMSINAED